MPCLAGQAADVRAEQVQAGCGAVAWAPWVACVRILFGVGVVFGFGSARVESVRGQIASPVRDVRSERSCRVASVGQGWGPWQVAWCRRLSRRGAAFPQGAPTCGGSSSEVLVN